MSAAAVRVALQEIESLRALFLQERNTLIRYDACHKRGWTDSYALRVDGQMVGYGSVKGREIPERDTIFEFYVLPAFRRSSRTLFADLISASQATEIECQSNDPLLCSLLYEFAADIRADVVLFEDDGATTHAIPGATVRPRREGDRIFPHTREPIGDFVLEVDGEIVGTGGFLLHYNPPFADLHLEIREADRGRGLGTFLAQELKKECYLAGRVPAARCNVGNLASRGALVKAGLKECGFLLSGRIKSTGTP